MGDEKENILRELRNSGFPTEIKVTEYIKNKSVLGMLAQNEFYWSYKNQKSYLDESENKVRPIDLCATVRHPNFLSLANDANNKSIKLYIECKKSDRAKWVFYTNPPHFVKYQTLKVLTNDKIEKYNPFDDVPESYNTINPHIGLTYQIVFSKKDEFYSAQMQALKAIYYCENTPPWKNVKTLIIPVVVFEGSMYRYDVTKEDPEIHEIRYLRYQSHGIPESPIPVYVDVVHIDFFSEYMKLIEKEIITL